jgi:hypothetical protein
MSIEDKIESEKTRAIVLTHLKLFTLNEDNNYTVMNPCIMKAFEFGINTFIESLENSGCFKSEPLVASKRFEDIISDEKECNSYIKINEFNKFLDEKLSIMHGNLPGYMFDSEGEYYIAQDIYKFRDSIRDYFNKQIKEGLLK